MNYRNFFTIFILLASVMLAPSVARAQTYQELDAELTAAEKKFWDTNLNPMYEKTAKEFDAGNYRQAIAEANKFLAYTPGATGSFPVLRGRAHLAAYKSDHNWDDFVNARADLIDAIRKDPKEPAYQVYLGDLFWEAHRGYEANRQSTKALELDPNNYSALEIRANVAYYVLDYQGCVAAINKWMAHPDFKKENEAWANFRLGICHASLGDQANAKQHFERAIALDASLKEGWYYLAFLKNGYSCKKIGTRLPEKPFEAFIAGLRSLSCGDGPSGSLYVLAGIEKENGMEYASKMHRAEAERLNNKDQISDSFSNKDAEYFFSIAENKLKSAIYYGKQTDVDQINGILELLNRVIIHPYDNPNILEADVDIMAREMHAKLLMAHPDQQMRILAWKDLAVLSNTKESYLQMTVNGTVRRKHLFKNGADVKTRLIGGMFYSQVKGNYQAALAEFDSAVKTLENFYVQSAFDVDVPLYAEPYWRKGDALSRLGESEAAYAAYERALAIKSDSLEAQNGMKTLVANNPQNAARLNQLLTKNTEERKANIESSLISEYNRLVSSNLSRLESQQRGVERKVSDYLNAGAGARVFMYRGVYSSINSAIDSHEAFITSLEKLRDRASGNSASVVSQIDSQIRIVKSSVEKLVRIRTGLPIGQ